MPDFIQSALQIGGEYGREKQARAMGPVQTALLVGFESCLILNTLPKICSLQFLFRLYGLNE
ncbi:hypothetical protein CRP01_22150 [Flavilitoribacter nigricans DSM 23189 = NBRC 102662]|uniref:Uncharacterized protein n=1 Tax=Flavilitoribacter nigricans (strain ATCC 23147 / DSM 23189 / NBRC 102662 / NCIMB 1420 / SS-2) TaxID=1122177 RepID=A0A2D0N731_FLAN2|nr:hypothetical protein CRP01_22150 [Flavilitoribacter nigricans DSM 23189 = NBRC 102662]